ncbi:MAG: VOC family protein [Burkholderiaceae bacterium]|jgi:predicted enzyme related to lactoylglutathione lyase|nr:VOC family protein [Burkholderiales bacterium]MCZ8097417.1 VOC family protein [Burkholderiales bacterium]MCZ8340712.1 VOC family protein [Burkholderiaceae bacterium]
MKPNPVVWFEIYVADMVRAKRFYETVLGATLSKLDDPDGASEMWAFPMADGGDGAAGALVRMDGVAPGGGGTLVYFGCDDCAVEAGRVEAAGGSVARPKFPIGPFGHIALVVDTEGNMVGLHSMR